MFEFTALSAAHTSLKALGEIVTVALSATVDNKVKQKLIEVQAAVLASQQQLVNALAQCSQLLEETQSLRQRLKESEDRSAALANYEMVPLDDGQRVYRYKGEADGTVAHEACPNCYQSRTISILQSRRTTRNRRLYSCAACSFRLTVGPSDPINCSDPINGSSPTGWMAR